MKIKIMSDQVAERILNMREEIVGMVKQVVAECGGNDERVVKQVLLENILDMHLTSKQIGEIECGWNAFYNDPMKYKGGVVVDMVKLSIDGGTDKIRRFYDPEYDREVTIEVVQSQYDWFNKQKWSSKQTFEEFALGNFREIHSDEELEYWKNI